MVEGYGGRYLIRAGEPHLLEGNLRLTSLVIVEFPSVEDALRCYKSPEYVALTPMRQESAASDLLLVGGRRAVRGLPSATIQASGRQDGAVAAGLPGF